MSGDGKSYSHGLDFPGALTILFVALRLLGKITWSWWWVLSPVWITASIVVLVLLVVFVVFVIEEVWGG